jgi:hypothetical protein
LANFCEGQNLRKDKAKHTLSLLKTSFSGSPILTAELAISDGVEKLGNILYIVIAKNCRAQEI